MTTARRIVCAGGTMQFAPCGTEPLSHGHLRVRTTLSGVRHVSDLAMMQGDRRLTRDEETSVPRAWCVAEVLETGPGCNGLSAGDVVHGLMHHAEEQVVPMQALYPIQWLRPEFALFADPGMAALRCIYRAHIQYGQRVLISGLGAVGLMAIQYARLSGATDIVAMDSSEERLRIARRLGANSLVRTDEDAQSRTKYHLDAAVDVSGSTEGLRQCMRMLRPGGRLIAGAFTYADLDPAAFIELTGNLDPVFECMFTSQRDAALEQTVITSLASQQVIVWPIISHIIPFEEAPSLYATMKADPNCHLKVLFTYGETPEAG